MNTNHETIYVFDPDDYDLTEDEIMEMMNSDDIPLPTIEDEIREELKRRFWLEDDSLFDSEAWLRMAENNFRLYGNYPDESCYFSDIYRRLRCAQY